MASDCVEEKKLNADNCICSICLETFKTPKILTCLHTFCQPCLNMYILSIKSKTSSPGYFPCPVCRAEVKPPDPKAPAEEWAKLLPMNHTAASIIDNSADGESLEEKKCDTCQREGELAQAEFWCFECQESLCQCCHKYHRRMKSTWKHRAVPICDVHKYEFQKRLSDDDEPCSEHKGEFLKVYCVDHQKMCCVLCLSIDHRKCENIKTFDEMTDIMKESDETQTLTKTMKTFCQKIEELIVKKEENIEGLGQHKQDILKDVAKMVEQAKEKLDKCHEDFKFHLSQTYKEQITKLVEAQERFEIFKKSTENCENMLQEVLKHGSRKQIFITSKKTKEHLEIQLRELQKLLQNDEDITFEININSHLFELNSSMTTIADIQLRRTRNNEQALAFVNSVLLNKKKDIFLQSQLRTTSIDNLEVEKVWHVNKFGSRFTDAAFLGDGKLLCVVFSTQTLVIYDQGGKLHTSYAVDYKPWSVTLNSDGNIFVSGTEKQGIRMYILSGCGLVQIKFIETKINPLAIDITQTTIVIQSGNSISLLSEDGKHRKTNCRCHFNSFIALSKSEPNCFYCCDGDYVIKYTLDGKKVMSHRLQNISSPRGIAVDSNGNIYVCGRDSGNVLVISEDFSYSRVLLESSTQAFEPYSIGFDQSGTKFFLTNNVNGTVTVYNLKVKVKP